MSTEVRAKTSKVEAVQATPPAFASLAELEVTSEGEDEFGMDAGLGKALAEAAANAAASPAKPVAAASPTQAASPGKATREAMVRQVFAALDEGGSGHIGSAAMQRFAALNGFDGSDEDWSEEFELMCEEWDCEADPGFSEALFTQWVNDNSEKGCECSDRELALIAAKLVHGAAPPAANAASRQTQLRERSRSRSPRAAKPETRLVDR